MISVENVTKVYKIRSGKRAALDGVSLQVRQGEKVGILGRNGAGKSTLIRIISGAEPPTSGRVFRGMSVSWPLAFGGAFQGSLTGLDNLRFVCRVYNADIKPAMEFVKDFSELGKYLYEPVKTYSAGMRARLAFSLSMAVDFDCFLIDEIAVVGDSRFHERCRIELFEKRKDKAMIIVSHDMGYTRDHCERAAVLVNGKLHQFDKTDEAMAFYDESMRTKQTEPMEPKDLGENKKGYSPVAPESVTSLNKNHGGYILNKSKEKLKVLMDLRPCLEGFAGIPQETRLIFHGLNNMENVEVTGLLSHHGRRLLPGLPQKKNELDRLGQHKKVHRLSRLALSVKANPFELWIEKAAHYIDKKIEGKKLVLGALLGFKIPVYDFDASDFGDFVWQTLFSKTLPAEDFLKIRDARYAGMRPPQKVLDRIAWSSLRRFSKIPMLDTSRYDVFLSQKPWRTRLTKNTQLVVRYHDAIPIFLPHTISDARIHQLTHMATLTLSQKRGIFACTSNATRDDLLKVFPHLEKRAIVIPDIVSHEYYVETGSREYIENITGNNAGKLDKPMRFIMAVATIEPRKNHVKLIRAWHHLKNHGMPDLKLVLVGETGWDNDHVLKLMAPWQKRKDIIHLHSLPTAQLRILYNAAETVVCPSINEGFDLSGIEAMLCGGAVVASDIPVHREIYGNACEYFNPYSEFHMAKAIENVIRPDRRNRRKELIEAGMKHAPHYRRESIMPYWHDLFERIRAGEFKQASGKAYSYEAKKINRPAIPDALPTAAGTAGQPPVHDAPPAVQPGLVLAQGEKNNAVSGGNGKKKFSADGTELVRAAYLGLLGREPDPEGLAAFTSMMASTDDVAGILKNISNSDEFKQKNFPADTAVLQKAPCSTSDAGSITMEKAATMDSIKQLLMEAVAWNKSNWRV